MAFANGVYSLFIPGNPVVTGTSIASTWANNSLSDIATALSTCVLKDGTQTITANIPMSSFKFTGLSAGSAAGHSVRWEQQFDANNSPFLGSIALTAAAGTNTITATAAPVPTAYSTGLRVALIPANTNTGATTLNVSTLGAKNVFSSGIALAGGELVASVPTLLEYDGTQFNIIGPTRTTRVLAKSGAAVSAPADVTEDTLVTITVPANALRANGTVRITTLWTCTNSVNSKTFRIRYSGGAGGTYMAIVGTTTASIAGTTMIANRNATNSQVGYTNAIDITNNTVVSTAKQTTAADTTASTTILITGQKAVAGETLTLESYLCEIIADGT